MRRERGSHLPSAQPIRTAPLSFNTRTATVVFQHALVVRLKNSLPRQPEASAEVTHVHHRLLPETLFNLAINLLREPTVVGNRRFSTLLRRDNAMEEQLQRPRERVGILVVQKDRLIGRMIGRAIDVAADATAR